MKSFVLVAGFTFCTAAAGMDAELAMRWSPAAGGPESGQRVSELLRRNFKAPTEFSVRYFDVVKPMDAPAGFDAALRERVRGGRTEVTWKYRATSSDQAPRLHDAWVCPLRGVAKSKNEVDVSVLAGGEVRRATSWSCTITAAFDVAVPASLQPKQRGCASKMSRYETGDEQLTLEVWRLSNGEVVLEVSVKGLDTPEQLTSFRRNVVDTLVAAGAVPLDRSKTEIGTRCRTP